MSSKRRVKRAQRRGRREREVMRWCDELETRRIVRDARAGKLHAEVVG